MVKFVLVKWYRFFCCILVHPAPSSISLSSGEALPLLPYSIAPSQTNLTFVSFSFELRKYTHTSQSLAKVLSKNQKKKPLELSGPMLPGVNKRQWYKPRAVASVFPGEMWVIIDICTQDSFAQPFTRLHFP